MSEEAAKQIDREDLALRVAEAPQLAQGLASDTKIVLPLPIPDSSLEALDPTLSPDPGGEPLLNSLALELSWQSAMAELLALVRLEGMATVLAPAASIESAQALELLLSSSSPELAATGVEQPAPPEQAHALTPTTPGFVDAAFGDAGPSVLSLQDLDLFGPESGPQAADYSAAVLDGESGRNLDFDLFGRTDAILQTKNPTATGALDPDDGAGIDTVSTASTASTGNAASAVRAVSLPNDGVPIDSSQPGVLTFAPGANALLLDQKMALGNADETNNLTIHGDGDDHLELVGDWVLVSHDPVKSVSVYAYSDSSVTVVADNVEVVLA